jgi:hypothetical protein
MDQLKIHEAKNSTGTSQQLIFSTRFSLGYQHYISVVSAWNYGKENTVSGPSVCHDIVQFLTVQKTCNNTGKVEF